MHHEQDALAKYVDRHHHIKTEIHIGLYVAFIFVAVCTESITKGTMVTLPPVVTVSSDAGQFVAPTTPAPVPVEVVPEAPLWAYRVPGLVATLRTYAPRYIMTDEQAKAHAEAALAAEQATGIDARLLLAIVWVESRYDPYSVSRMECINGTCRRRTGHWDKDAKPPGARPTYYCGVTQVGGPISWDKCKELRGIDEAYLTGAIHLDSWMFSKPCRNLKGTERENCGLRGYNGGWASIRNKSKTYVGMVRRAHSGIQQAESQLQ